MKTTVFVKAGQVAVQEVEKPQLVEADDAIIRVVRTCVCGSDLWGYRGDDDKAEGSDNSGHEIIGVIEEVGSAITTLKKGDFVIAPFTHGCGHCAA
ncbi:alcohol dehydrogenase catalytic domain-containing protein, partial [Streptococcus sobrinus]